MAVSVIKLEIMLVPLNTQVITAVMILKSTKDLVHLYIFLFRLKSTLPRVTTFLLPAGKLCLSCTIAQDFQKF